VVLGLHRQSDEAGTRREESRANPSSHTTYIGHALLDAHDRAGATQALALLAGAWRGYFTDHIGMKHQVCEFILRFESDGCVSGDGTDIVGRYTIRGKCGNGRLAFSKHYVAGSKNTMGVVDYGNKGHIVEYRGEVAGSSVRSHGFRGAWSIRGWGNYDGTFHLWPAGAHVDTEETTRENQTFIESECCVCYDRQINTCLKPCNHAALCNICAFRLFATDKKCPLCRVPIAHVEDFSPVGGSPPGPWDRNVRRRISSSPVGLG
jgi:hypothetical protein